MPAPATRNLTILLTDIKGFTDKTGRLTRADINEMLAEHRRVVLPALETRGGKLIKSIGDAFLMIFESPTDAVLAGVDVQEALAQRNAGRPQDDRLEVRIAINLGEVNLAENDIFGEAVNITARIEGIAEAGEVFFTEAVYLAMNKREVPSSEVGLLQLKGIPEKIRVYKVRRENPVEGATRPTESIPRKDVDARGRPPLWRRAASLGIDLALCGLISNILFNSLPGANKDDSSRVRISDEGIEIEDGKARIAINDDGIETKGDISKWTGPSMKTHARRANPLFPLLWLLYGFLFLWHWKTTPGLRILKLAVVSKDGAAVNPGQAFLRSLASVLSGYVLGLGYLWGAWEKEGRCWHDLLANTKVINAD